MSLGRWSSDLRVRRTLLSDRLGIDFRNQCRPVFDELGNLVLSSRNAFTVDLTEVVGLRFTIQTEYDSGARERGADTNWDGQIQFGVVASFRGVTSTLRVRLSWGAVGPGSPGGGIPARGLRGPGVPEPACGAGNPS